MYSKLRLLVFLVLLSIACNKPVNEVLVKSDVVSTPLPTTIDKKIAKNIIFLIGDGMGIGQITAGTYSNGNTSNLERFKVCGIHKNYASDKLVTDSAAGATAFSCGIKTYNGAIAVDPDKKPVKTILEEAEEKKKSTGLLATCSIVHATPASYIAHNEYRKNYEAIATDFLETELDFFVGGGLKYFNQREADSRNLITELQNKDYVINDYFNDELQNLNIDNSRNFGYFTANGEPLPFNQGREYLEIASEKALNFLDNHGTEGFFLMIEGSQIDWGGHANNHDYIISEFKEFDRVVGQALDFAKKDKNTLVVVTADHETGGFTIQQESTMDSLVTVFTSDYHTADFIPVFAYGPGAELFGGVYENTAIYNKMRQAFGWAAMDELED